jgi:hypothetical protein
MTAGTEIARIETGGYLVLSRAPDDIQAVIARSLGDTEIGEFDLPRVKIPAGGGRTWEIGDDESGPELTGILIHFKRTRAYWPDQEPNGSPPQCRSDNSIEGIGDPGGPCRLCPNAQWGSDPKGGRGQACAQAEVWFMLRPELVLPLVLKLPATSLTNAKDYRVKTLAARALAPEQVVTSVRLEVETNPDGQKYSVAVPRMAGMLSEEEAARALAYAETFRPQLDAAARAVTVSDDSGTAPANGAPAAEESMVDRAREAFGDEPAF